MLTHTSDQQATQHSPLLVLTGPLEAHREAVCTDLICAAEPDAALVFSHCRSPRVISDTLVSLDELTVLSLGNGHPESPSVPAHASVAQCPADNLTQAGVAVNEAIDRHDGSMSVCLGSVTAMLQYVDGDTACQFLAAALTQLESVDGVVHAHMDPAAVCPETAASVESRFEAVLERETNGWAIETA